MADPLAGQAGRALPRRAPRLRRALAGAAAHPRPQGRARRRSAAASRCSARRRSPTTSPRSPGASTSAPTPTPFEEAQRLAARGLGRAAHLVPRQRRLAGQPRRRARARPLRRRGRAAAQRPLEHDRRAGPLGHAPDVRRARDRRGARHRPLPAAREPRRRARAARPGAVAAWVVSPTYFGAMRRRARARRGRPRATACRWSSTRRGARTSRSATRCPSTRSPPAPTS